ncbi:hypothetical protein M316_0116 [Nitrincola phage 1M3-16]|uniref:hypothetical protein n=1 Tax=Nitrincola phage 1M3-16 TaxID=1472912 RepID=UPI000444C369|nr:hypothetical protein GJ22_gp036 [Nitrincola phage 1M3-16]AHX01181.1 hypothetical protein M316_0116 [Nitrincola phage 1M3-16]
MPEDLKNIRFKECGRDYPYLDCYGLFRYLNSKQKLPKEENVGYSNTTTHSRLEAIDKLERTINSFMEVCTPEECVLAVSFYNRGKYLGRMKHLYPKYLQYYVDLCPAFQLVRRVNDFDGNPNIKYYRFKKNKV